MSLVPIDILTNASAMRCNTFCDQMSLALIMTNAAAI